MSQCRVFAPRLGNSFLATLIVLLVGAVAPFRAHALVINVTGPSTAFLNNFGPAQPPAGVTLIDLINVMNAAGDYWEGILDSPTPRTISIQTGFSARLSSNTLAAAIGGNPSSSGLIAFNRNFSWFADPTPFDNSEYTTFTETFADLGGGLLNVSAVFGGATGAAADKFDLFDTALHEIGHILGLSAQFANAHLSGPLEILDPLPFAGSLIPLTGGHISLADALMGSSTGPGERDLPSDADILAIAQAGGFTEVTLRPTQAVPEPHAVMLFLAAAAIAGLLAFGAKGHRSRATA